MGSRHLAGLRVERATVIVLGLYLTGTSLDALGRGRLLYTNYLGLPMPAPLALCAGILLVIVGTIWWARVLRER